MDDPGWAWPAWKFDLKRDDLFTSLHDKYNTFTFSLQDPEAFHADVYEISQDADTTEEFHRLMADRRRQRLQELHESLESLAVEIIANPRLMDSEHWGHALQLFRTKSFDSLVRYFASYLPESYLEHQHPPTRSTSTTSSFSDAASVQTASTKASSVDDAHAPIFTDGPVMTDEPCPLDHDECPAHSAIAPLSPPESEPMLETAASSPSDLECRSYTSNSPSRSMSFSGSESEAFGPDFRRSLAHDDSLSSQSDDCDTAVTSISDCDETRSPIDSVEDDHHPPSFAVHEEEEDDDLLTTQFPEDDFDAFDFVNDTPTLDSDTPTPRPDTIAASYVEYKSTSRRLATPPRRSPSPKRHRVTITSSCDIRRSPEEAASKIQKHSPDPIRRRPKGRI